MAWGPSYSLQNVSQDLMGQKSKAGLVSAFALTVTSLAGAPAVRAESGQDSAARIVELCLSRSQDEAGCSCAAREIGSRFLPDQLAIIAEAMEAGRTASQISAILVDRGMPEAEVASFAHRLESADVVIQQTCGASIFARAED
jgi:hypothetical protein